MNAVITPQNYTTEEFAELICYKPGAIRTRLCKAGSFYGIRPIKLPSGRLLWPAEKVSAFLSGQEV
ncbi:DNA-binding protein [Alteromonas sediminis]|uniref:DNA-binding protein n=1 Tax=Alteromonas sediminis TaxID=2259342 RepID=A0A3N5Y451_9ALTE|nr:DNA-binding protein [Alteromonas sediminis]RPJ68230.1 DNA-binding protein [Alteromonas sediminis]